VTRYEPGTASAYQELTALLRRRHGAAIFSEGDKERAFYVIAEGGVAVSINGVRIRDLPITLDKLL